MPLYVGTSGWQYKHWLGRFYPRNPRPVDDLDFFARRFQTVEVNNSFYRLPEEETFAAWERRAPNDFIFALRASRYLTHIKRLRDPEEPVERLMTRARRLGKKLGPILLQLPPDLQREPERLRRTLDAFGPSVRVSVEFRHESWFTEEVRVLLEERYVTLCLADRAARLITPAWRTAAWGYVRFHGGLASPGGCYGVSTIEDRARMVASLWGPADDVYVYFNNDLEGCALIDAHSFAERARQAGLHPTRVADWWEVRAGAVAGSRDTG